MSTARLTEIKTVDVWSACINNPVCLMWYAPNSGPCVWVFGYKQQRGLTTKEIGMFIPYIEDLETAESDGEFLGMNVLPSLVVGCHNVTTDQMLIIESLIATTRCLMLTNPDTWESEGCDWVTVRITPGSYKTVRTDQSHHNVELTINLPRINTQTQ